MIRLGIGYDIHRLKKGRSLILGGVSIPYEYGLEGHSDADVLTHAIIDAIIGALGKGDIGLHFPDTDPRFKDVRSLDLLKEVALWMKKEGFILNNLDSIIVCQKPKLMPYIPEMRRNISEAIGADEGRINIKAKTKEGLESVGKGKAIESYATVTLIKEKLR